jgi:long-chain fatty acid transport protein
MLRVIRSALVASTAIVLCSVAVDSATAGGFAIREQSAQFQGASFAGSAAGGGLSSMYWNPAALGQAGTGLTYESHFAVIFPQAEVTVETYQAGAFNGLPIDSGDIGSPAIVGASYYAYKLSERLTLGMSLNSGFGLVSKPRNLNYLGAELGRTAKLFTINAAPTLGYRIAPGITIGVGAQIQYARAKLAFASGAPFGPSSVYKDADDFAFGATAGILFEPTAGTSIGLGYRSQLSHELDGRFSFAGGPFQSGVTADLDLPDIVTLSIRQAIAPNMRLLGTVEWSQWSRFEELVLKGAAQPLNAIPANWSDGWFFALGGEYDLNPGMTLRTGIAYEISPTDSPEKRFTSIPDADRVWLSGGATFRLSESTTADFAYTHIFIQNGDFERETLTGNAITGYIEAQDDIWSVSLKTRWGGEPVLQPLK